jgi:hypothetical protein
VSKAGPLTVEDQLEELLKTIQEKTGLPVEKAQDVIETVVGFIADKLPGPIGDQVKGFLGDDDADAGGDGGGDDEGGGLLDQAKDMLGGLLGGDE